MTTIGPREAYSILELPIGADPDAIRTSYKRLAQKWHPDKNKSSEAMQKFQQVSQAFAVLGNPSNSTGKTLSLEAMYTQYQQIMRSKFRHDDEYDSSGDPDSCTTSDSENDPMSSVFNYFGSTANRRKFQQDHGDGESDNDLPLTAEQREQLANELITEEEKKKRQLEKRRLKKKQRREKKRLEKQPAEQPKQENSKKSEKLKEQTSKLKKDKINDSQQQQQQQVETEDDDSTSFTQSSRRKLEATARLKNEEDNHSSPIRNKDNLADDIDPVIVRSRQFAIQGNSMACSGQYAMAIECFTKAIQLDGSDYRFFGNRSYCHERLDQFDKALKDANKSISLAPDWPKGYFRKGRALLGLKNYAAAEEAFMQVLKLDSKCDDARQELNRVRTCQLMEMGFSQNHAQNAARQFDSLQQALDSLLAGLVSENPDLGEVYISDEEDATPATTQPSAPQQQPPPPPNSSKSTNNNSASGPKPASNNSSTKAPGKTKRKNNEPLPPIPQSHYEEAARQMQMSRAAAAAPPALLDDIKMDPNNPEGLTSLWVGNVQQTVTQEALYEMFSKFGALQSVRVLPEKFCAFVNYIDKTCAGRAMQGLQGQIVAGQPLLIKFPDNPVASAGGGGLPEKPVVKSIKAPPVVMPSLAAVAASGTKLRGPVNGDECYFWRTTGCQFTTGCRYRHVPENKGIDKKPWQRVAK